MAPPRTVVTTSSCSLLRIYRPRKDERLSWPSWLTYSGRFTHISGHPSAVGRAQDSESSSVKDQRSTAELSTGTSPSISHWLSACSICTYLQRCYCLILILCNKTHDDDDQCNSSGQFFVFCGSMKNICFHSKKPRCI